MRHTWTYSTWIVKPGQEDEFVRRWRDWAEHATLYGFASKGRLLRDRDNPSRFISFGRWESPEQVAHWRGAADFHEHTAPLHEVIESFTPHTFEEVAEA
jgi:heme-degrading monooxygenase HmoA